MVTAGDLHTGIQSVKVNEQPLPVEGTYGDHGKEHQREGGGGGGGGGLSSSLLLRPLC